MNDYVQSKQPPSVTTFSKPVLQSSSADKIPPVTSRKEHHQGTLDPYAKDYIPLTQGGYKELNDGQHTSLHSNDMDPGRTFQELLQQQNDITKLLIDKHQKSTLPPCEIPPFDGDPLEYRSFMRAFEHGIEDKTKSSKDRIYYLEQFTSGEPNNLVRSCMHMEPNKGYEQAKKLLKNKYGDEHKIAMAYIDKAMNWQQSSPKTALRWTAFQSSLLVVTTPWTTLIT